MKMVTRVLVLIILVFVGIHFLKFINSEPKPDKNKDSGSAVSEAAPAAESAVPSPPDAHQPTIQVTPETAASTTAALVPSETIKKKLTKSEFASKFRYVEFQQVLAKSKAFSHFDGNVGRDLPGWKVASIHG